jgi:hypothetical protein
LDLSSCGVGDEGARVLANGSFEKVCINLFENVIGVEESEILRRCDGIKLEM